MRKSAAFLAGQRVRAWKCGSCGEEIAHPLDAQAALSLNKLKCGVGLKVGELNKAPYVRFTKDFSVVLRKGAHAVATLLSPTEIRIKLAD